MSGPMSFGVISMRLVGSLPVLACRVDRAGLWHPGVSRRPSGNLGSSAEPCEALLALRGLGVGLFCSARAEEELCRSHTRAQLCFGSGRRVFLPPQQRFRKLEVKQNRTHLLKLPPDYWFL